MKEKFMKLSKHVTIAEFIKSNTAIKNKIDNNFDNEEHLNSAKNLCEKVFEPLRAFVGSPILISSGYRSAKLNKAVGGSNTSQHCKGEAMDIDGSGDVNLKYFNYIKDNLNFDQLIAEFPINGKPSWVHVSLKRNGINRKQILIITTIKGKKVELPYKGNEKLVY